MDMLSFHTWLACESCYHLLDDNFTCQVFGDGSCGSGELQSSCGHVSGVTNFLAFIFGVAENKCQKIGDGSCGSVKLPSGCVL